MSKRSLVFGALICSAIVLPRIGAAQAQVTCKIPIPKHSKMAYTVSCEDQVGPCIVTAEQLDDSGAVVSFKQEAIAQNAVKQIEVAESTEKPGVLKISAEGEQRALVLMETRADGVNNNEDITITPLLTVTSEWEPGLHLPRPWCRLTQ